MGLYVNSHGKSHQLPFQECWSIHGIHKLLDATPNLKRCTNLYFNRDRLLISTSNNLTQLLPSTPLVAPGSITLLSFYSWWKSYCWLKAPFLLVSINSLDSPIVWRYESGGCCSFLTFLTNLLSNCIRDWKLIKIKIIPLL